MLDDVALCRQVCSTEIEVSVPWGGIVPSKRWVNIFNGMLALALVLFIYLGVNGYI